MIYLWHICVFIWRYEPFDSDSRTWRRSENPISLFPSFTQWLWNAIHLLMQIRVRVTATHFHFPVSVMIQSDVQKHPKNEKGSEWEFAFAMTTMQWMISLVKRAAASCFSKQKTHCSSSVLSLKLIPFRKEGSSLVKPSLCSIDSKACVEVCAKYWPNNFSVSLVRVSVRFQFTLLTVFFLVLMLCKNFCQIPVFICRRLLLASDSEQHAI